MTEFKEFKYERINQMMDKDKLDVLIASLPENVYYLSGLKSVSQQILNRVKTYAIYDRKTCNLTVVLPCADVPTWIEQSEDLHANASSYGTFFFALASEYSQQTAKIKQIVDEKMDTPEHALLNELKKINHVRRIGLDEGRVSPQTWLELMKALPDIDIVPAADVFGEIRMVKHRSEIQHLEKAAQIAEESLHTILSRISVGMTELDMEQAYIEEVVKRGGRPYYHVMTVGNRTAYVDTTNTNKPIRDGDLLRFDLGCIYNGYRSDIARTAVVGKASAKVEKLYQSILDGLTSLVEQIQPGVTATTLFDQTIEKVREGIPHYNRQHVGHGIGLEIYDPPVLGPGSNIQLESGMVLCVETPYYELDWGGVQIEDTIVVTDDGCRYLTKSSQQLIRIGE